MDLNWLHDFECLARTLNFTRASEERNITQSAFSRRIKALESWVGLPLVNRATYPVQLTEAGEQFLPIALGAVSKLSDTRQALRDADRGNERFVRFSVLHTISVNYLAPRLDSLQIEFPEIRTRVFSDSLGTCCDLLMSGSVDFMLCYRHYQVALSIDETAFERKDIKRDQLIPVARSDVAQKMGWNLDAQSKDPIPYLAYEQSSFLGMVVEDSIDRKTFNVRTIYVDGLVETIKRRLLCGGGFAWMPKTAIEHELKDGRLTQIGGSEWCSDLTISAFGNPAQFDQTAKALWQNL